MPRSYICQRWNWVRQRPRRFCLPGATLACADAGCDVCLIMKAAHSVCLSVSLSLGDEECTAQKARLFPVIKRYYRDAYVTSRVTSPERVFINCLLQHWGASCLNSLLHAHLCIPQPVCTGWFARLLCTAFLRPG